MPTTVNTSKDAVEHMIRGLITAEVISPTEFFGAVSNAFCHGEIIDQFITENDLAKIHDNIDEIIEITRTWE